MGLSHFTGEVRRLLQLITKYDQDNYPEMLGRVCLINVPRVFQYIWPIVKGYLDPRTVAKIEVRRQAWTAPLCELSQGFDLVTCRDLL